ncbi:MAG: hypothetical protein ACRD3E_11590 [Terriglobales bacterium]
MTNPLPPRELLQQATKACRAWHHSHRDTPGAAAVNPAMFLRETDGAWEVVAEPSAEDLAGALEIFNWFRLLLADARGAARARRASGVE